MKTLMIVVLILFNILIVAAQQQQHRTLTISQSKNAPIEVVSVELGTQSVVSGKSFATTGDWMQQLKIKVKNISAEPISSIEVFVVVDSRTKLNTLDLLGVYSFGKPTGTWRLLPEDTVILENIEVSGESGGDQTIPGNARIMLQSVFWNGDDSIKWHSGKILRRVWSLDPSEPPTYKPMELQSKRYQFPKGYQSNWKLVKAASSALPQCNATFDQESFSYCDLYCPGGYRCWVPFHMTLQGECTGLDCNTFAFQTSRYCYNAACNQPLHYCGSNPTLKSTQIVDHNCAPPGTPVIIDVAGNGFQGTDLAGGVVFNIAPGGARNVSWTAVGSDDSFLCLDRNGNNNPCEDYSELFGNYTQQLPSFSPNGFKAMALLDSDGDTELTRSDRRNGQSLFDQLVLWRDINHNGICESDETVKLSATSITALETRDKISRFVDDFGNERRARAKVRGGAAQWAGDWWLLVQ